MSGPIIFHHVRYTVGELRHLPENDVVYLFMVKQLHNDVAALLLMVSVNFPKEGQQMPLQVRGSVVSFMAIRLLAGRLEEGWKTIKTRFQQVFATYSDKMDEESIESHKEIRSYFAKKNLIRSIRDKASFHFDSELIGKAYRSMDDSAKLVDYISRGLGNTTYFSAEGMQNQALLQLVPDRPEDNGEAMDFVIGEVARIANLFLTITTAYILAFYKTNMPEHLEAMRDDYEIVENMPELDAMQGLQFIFSEVDAPAALGNRLERRAARKRGKGSSPPTSRR